MNDTKIEWTDRTYNPASGCTKISAGCKHCYAETIAERFRGSKGYPNGFEFTLKEARLCEPLSWTKPSRVFVNSMSDLFHEEMPQQFLGELFGVMGASSTHTFQILTKRPQRALDFLAWAKKRGVRHLFEMAAEKLEKQGKLKASVRMSSLAGSLSLPEWPLPNIHLGVSVEDARVTGRIDLLRKMPAAVKFLSIEPLIGPLGKVNLNGINWVIIGGESGDGARPLELDWLDEIMESARESNCAIFVKQMGEHWAKRNNATYPKGGDPLEWPPRFRVREFPTELATQGDDNGI